MLVEKVFLWVIKWKALATLPGYFMTATALIACNTVFFNGIASLFACMSRFSKWRIEFVLSFLFSQCTFMTERYKKRWLVLDSILYRNQVAPRDNFLACYPHEKYIKITEDLELNKNRRFRCAKVAPWQCFTATQRSQLCGNMRRSFVGKFFRESSLRARVYSRKS